jgi:heterodisulfide reductase subunit A-like polyferredoxin
VKIEKKKMIGAVLVEGGGIAGVQASLDLANSGYKVYLVNRSATIGGMMAHLDKTFPTGDCAEVGRMRQKSQHRNSHTVRTGKN